MYPIDVKQYIYPIDDTIHVPTRRQTIHVPNRRQTIHVPNRRQTIHVPNRRYNAVNIATTTSATNITCKRVGVVLMWDVSRMIRDCIT